MRFTCRLAAGEAIWVLPYEVHSNDTAEENDAAAFIFSTDMMPDFFSLWTAGS